MSPLKQHNARVAADLTCRLLVVDWVNLTDFGGGRYALFASVEAVSRVPAAGDLES